jgi:triacylglycerol lipase
MIKTALRMALLSKLVYEDYNKINRTLLKMGLKDWYWFDNEGTQAVLIKTNKELIVCFRGTEPDKITDIMADLKVWRKPAREKGLVHFGFAQALDRVYDKIIDQISRLDVKNLKIICTGHSLGAALATIFASRIDAKFLYTFGSPRVGNKDFVREMTNDGITHYRFVNNNDIVTKVPLWLMMYRHHGELIYINHYGNIRPMTWWQRFKDGLRGRRAAWWNKQPFDGVRDHDIGAYYNKINSESFNASLQSKK